MLYRRTPRLPTVIDDVERLVSGVLVSPGARVRRQGIDGPFIEILEPGGVVTDDGSVPLLNAHRADSTSAVLGSAYDFRLEDGALVATLQFSARPGVIPIWRDVKDGHLGRLSAGYEILEFQDSKDPRTGERVRTVTKWRLREVSLVPLAADAGAAIRSGEEEVKMPDDVKKTPADSPGHETQSAAAPTEERREGTQPQAENRAEVNRQIRSMTAQCGFEERVGNDLIDRGLSADEARESLWTRMMQRPQPAKEIRGHRIQQGGPSNDDPDVMRQRMADALVARMVPGYKPEEAAQQFRGLSLTDCQRALWLAQGDSRAATLGAAAIVQRAAHTTSDFATLLQSSGNRVLLMSFEAESSGLKRASRQTTLIDFRAKTSIRLGDIGRLEKVEESGEITSTSRAESRESYKLATYGKLFDLSRQAIINDDLGAFTDWATAAGRSAADTEAWLLVELLTANAGAGPTMDDGNPLFHSSHGNLAGSGTALGIPPLTAARLAMRKQTGPGGMTIAITPRSLLVPPDLETAAEQLLATIQPDSVGNVNVFSGKLELLVEPRLTDPTAYYLFAGPSQAAVLEYAYLSSASGPQMETRQGWEVLGTSFRVYLDFGAGAIDYRGAYKDPGA